MSRATLVGDLLFAGLVLLLIAGVALSIPANGQIDEWIKRRRKQ